MTTCNQRRTWRLLAAAAGVAIAAPAALADDPAPPPAGAPAATALEAAIPRSASGGPDEILVIGRRTPDGVPVVPIDAVGSRDVFGPDRVRETGARDVNDLVIHIPAISTRPYNGGEAAAPSFSMRGLPDDGLTEYIHVLLDGVPASPLPYGWTAFSFLPVTAERIYAVDFIRGAHSVRYSPNTVGGVLNFVTQPIPVEPVVSTRATFGNLGYASTLFSAGGTKDCLGALFTVVDRSGDGYRDNGGFEQRDANAKLRFDTGGGGWVSASVSRMTDEHQAPGGLTLDEYDAHRFANARPLNRFEGHRTGIDLVWHEPIDRGWIQGFAHYADTFRHLRAQRPHFGAPTSMLDWTDTTEVRGAGFRAERAFDVLGMEHTLFGGGRVLEERLPSYFTDSTPWGGGATTPTRDSSYALDTWSLHLDDTVRPVEDLTLNAGVRLERVTRAEGSDDITGFAFQDEFRDALPGFGAAWRVTGESALFANYFEGFRAPQVWGFGSAAPGRGLAFEESASTELGFRFRDVHGISGSVTRWRLRADDFGVFFSGFYENLGRIESEGTDFELAFDVGSHVEALAGLTLGASLTDQESTLLTGPDEGNDSPYAWDKKAAWTIRYATADDWVFGLNGTYVGKSFSDTPNTAADSSDGTLGINPSRTLWDAQVSKRIALSGSASLQIAAGATNVFDQEWFVHSRGGFFGGGKVAGPPRQTYVSFGLEIKW